MLYYLLRRLIYMVIIIAMVSVVAFVIIQLPPGDYLSSYMLQLMEGGAAGSAVSESEIASLRMQYGLDQPIYTQYFLWIWNIVRYGRFGRSFQHNRPVSELIWERLGLTIAISLCTLVFVFAVAIPIGIYSAIHQYSKFDYFFTVVGYAGLATPNFLLALVLMFIGYKYLNTSVGGLFSPQYLELPFSWGKFFDLLSHLWIPVIVLGTAGTAGLIRVMRGMLLDELGKQYVITARAKGLKERALLFKYPVRVALNPIVSTIGWSLAGLISGAPIVAIVLSLPTTGPMMLAALMAQDMYLAGTFLLILSVFTVIGTYVSDILLALLDPRIRME